MATVRRCAWLRATGRVAAVLVGVYAAFCTAACALQDGMVFPRDVANQGVPSGPLRSNIQQHWLDTEAGRVEAWFIPARGAGDTSHGSLALTSPTVIFFHGNGALIDYSLNIADIYSAMGFNVLLPEYRGYGRSAGRPSQKAITADMIRWRQWLDTRAEVDPSRVVYHGQSLGGGVAAALARTHPPRALVLHSTFTSVAALAERMGIPGFVVRHPFRTDEFLASYEGPVLILHGTEDRAIPVEHGRQLAALSRRSTLVVGPGGHNDYPDDTTLARVLREFLGGLAQEP